MLFLNNKYTDIYYSIIFNAKSRSLNENFYYENHHIIPKCLGGSDNFENMIKLTAREHFICHWLLTKMSDNTNHKLKLISAFQYMLFRENEYQQRYKISSRIYETIKTNISKEKSKLFSGAGNPMYGKKHTQKSKDKISKKNKGRKWNHSVEAKEKISKALTGIKRSDDFKQKLSKANRGKIESEETRLKKSKARIGKKHSSETLKRLSENSGRAKQVEINGVAYKSMKEAASLLFPDLPLYTGVRRIKKMITT